MTARKRAVTGKRSPAKAPAAKATSARRAAQRASRAAAAAAAKRDKSAGDADVTFFATLAAWRGWLARNHATATDLWVGFHKRHTDTPSITWPESVAGALCFGWIDGLRKRIDANTYKIRFTPRKAGSIWSAVNVRRVETLRAEGSMQPAGEAAFALRRANKSGVYSYEQRPAELPEPFLGRLKKQRAAWAFFSAQPPWYRRTATWWVISAKKDETRARRFAQLVDDLARGAHIAPLRSAGQE
jgi:uncharacterized protein YdeI (YjbR/CyaY-like superfamily)